MQVILSFKVCLFHNAQSSTMLNYSLDISYIQNPGISQCRDKSKDVISTNRSPGESGSGSRIRVTPNAAGNKQNYYFEGFESGNFNDWIDDGGYGIKEVVNTTSASGQYSFHYNSQSSLGVNTGIHQSFVEGTRPDYISFNVRSGSTTKDDGYFVILSPEGHEIIWFFTTNYDKLYVNNDIGGDASFTYNADEWYKIEFRDIDWTDKDFDYYVNGTLIKADIPMRNADLIDDMGFVYLFNYSDYADAWWDNINIGGKNFSWLSTDVQSGSIPGNESQNINVRFNAKDITAGTYHANINITSDDPVNPVMIVPAQLYIAGIPSIAIGTDSVDFGKVMRGSADSVDINILNNGSDLLKIDTIYTSDIHFSAAPLKMNLSPGENFKLNIRYIPDNIQVDQGNLYIHSNDSLNSTAIVSLLGESVMPPVITVVPDSFRVDLDQYERKTGNLAISNQTGGSELIYSVEVQYNNQDISSSYVKSTNNQQYQYDNANKTELPVFVKKQSVGLNAESKILVLEEGVAYYFYDQALGNLGYSRTLVTDWSNFYSELTNGTLWDLVIVNSYGSYTNAQVLDSLTAYISHGGLLIYASWDVEYYCHKPAFYRNPGDKLYSIVIYSCELLSYRCLASGF